MCEARNCIEIGIRDANNSNSVVYFYLISFVVSEFDGFNEETKPPFFFNSLPPSERGS